MITNKNDIMYKLSSVLSDYEGKLSAWENVKVVVKKDGSEFKVLSKNFENASVEMDSYWEALKSLQVNYKNKRTSYNTDSIDFYREATKTEIEGNNPQVYKRVCLTAEYIYTVEEMKENIKNHIEWIKKKIEEVKRQISLSNRYFDIIDKKVSEINKILNCDELLDQSQERKVYKSSLGYSLQEYVKNNIM